MASRRLETAKVGGGDGPRPLVNVGALFPDPSHAERLRGFLAHLERMTQEERRYAGRYWFTSWERQVWAGRYPEEVPTVNGEYEWIALGLVDLE